MKIIVGLGNPGEKYKSSRHNLGFLALDWLNPEATWQHNKKFNALTFNKEGIIFVKPQTFMNNSGLTVSQILNYYKLLEKKLKIFTKKNTDLQNILYVIHDDLDINIGEVKTSVGSSSAGHKGVSSIIDHIKTQDFTRLRVGIKDAARPKKMPTSSFVLQSLNPQELETIKPVFLNTWEKLKNSFNK